MGTHRIDTWIAMEDELNLYKEQVDGFFYWLYIREELYSSIVAKLNKSGEGFNKTRISPFKLPIIALKVAFLPKYHLSKRARNVNIAFFCHPRRVLDGNTYMSTYTDLIAEEFPSSVSLEYPHEGMHYTPAFSKNICYLDAMYYWRELYLRLAPYALSKTDEQRIKEMLTLVQQKIIDYFSYEISVQEELNRVKYLHKRYRYTKNYFEKLLSRVNPKVIVEVVYYRFENLVLNEVAKYYCIPIVELQHGLTGKYHIAYNYGITKCCNTLPDIFLSFSEYWKDNMRLPKSVRIESVGFPYFERTMAKYPKKNSSKTILFLSSGTVGADLSKVAIDMSKLCEDNDYEVIYKLHPGEFYNWKKRYPELLASGIKVIDNAKINLYELFAKSYAQVGVYSTALFEGLGYGLKTFIVRRGEMEHVQCLLDLGYAKSISSAEDIYSALMNNGYEKDYDITYFWKRKAKDNILRILNSLY